MKHSVPAGDHRHLVTGRGDHDRMATGGLYKVDVACVRAGVATRSPSTRAATAASNATSPQGI